MEWLLRLRLQHLQLLVDLSKSGNLTQTAQASHTTQPGLSKWLKDLEEAAGFPLFQRHARGLRLTEYGSLVLGHAERILHEVRRTQLSVKHLREGHGVHLSIGASPAVASTLVPSAILEFLRGSPRARVDIAEDTMNALLARLESGEVDVVVGRLDNYALSPFLNYEVLYGEPIRMIARPSHPLVCKRHLQWADLYRYDWIVWPTGSPIRSQLDTALTRCGLDYPPIRIESSSQLTNICLLQHSDMVSVASWHVAERFASLGLVQSLPMLLGTQGAVGMCWRDEPFHGSSTSEFLQRLRDRASAMSVAASPDGR